MVTAQNSSKSMELALESIDNLPQQGLQIWEESENIDFPNRYSQINNIVICGMGGSSLPAYIIQDCFDIKVPLQIIEGYTLPSWANKQTLVILSSYSGNTEETLSCASHAEEKQCLITGITTGGSLEQFFKNANYPYCKINPIYNPSEAPRMGVGYGIFGILKILFKLELIDSQNYQKTQEEILNSLNNIIDNRDSIKKASLKVYPKLMDKIVITLTAEHLGGIARTLTNQLNETSKILSFYKHLPEADHNLVEGFTNSSTDIFVIFLRSINYTPRILKRMDITQKIIDLHKFETLVYQLETPFLATEPTKLEEAISTLVWAGFITTYIAHEKGIDPLEILLIDDIKKELSGS